MTELSHAQALPSARLKGGGSGTSAQQPSSSIMGLGAKYVPPHPLTVNRHGTCPVIQFRLAKSRMKDQ